MAGPPSIGSATKYARVRRLHIWHADAGSHGLTAASVQAEVGPGQPHDLVVTLGDLEAGGSRSTRDVVQRRPVTGGGTGRNSETERLVAGRVKLESGSSLDERGSRGEGGEDGDEGESRQHGD